MPSTITRNVATTCGVILVVLAGCAPKNKPPGPTVAQAWENPAGPHSEEPPAATGPRLDTGSGLDAEPIDSDRQDALGPAPEAAGQPIASVNGRAISRQRATDILIDAYGRDVVELLIRLELSRQLAASRGGVATLPEVRDEYDEALRRISSPVLGSEETDFDRAAAERLLDAMLLRNGISKTQFMLKIEQDANLRKAAEQDVVVDDSQLTAEHDRAYGERVQVRHMQLNTLSEVAEVREQLDAGVDFELLVRKYSRNQITAAAGGLLPPFSRHDDVPPLLRQAAFSLQEGQISDTFFEDNTYQIIRLERRFPPTEISVDLVREELRSRLRRRLVEDRMRQLAADLFDNADIEIADLTLLRQLQEQYPNARIR
jgi:hypothetical protein